MNQTEAKGMVQLIRAERTKLTLSTARTLLTIAGMSYSYITTEKENGVNQFELDAIRALQLAHVNPDDAMVYLIPITPEYP
ncbi:hypothetical protein ACFQ5D_09145 [Paenibacillus farraposensis]|uniref:XRE family transcriptional regulator n=1 Tax=Paenibacillus farraposensis TaxID=2807095 RepID=A0ABW4DEH9_9BACL|nr:hypothetical protein [Paenibacillus farraposensis]MCC3379915.1 hypothetical protein [Paenibacillus farraposensis]